VKKDTEKKKSSKKSEDLTAGVNYGINSE